MEFSHYFWEWMVAVFEQWHVWLSGGLLAFGLEVSDRIWDWKPPKKVYLYILLTGLFVSFFLTWRDEHKKANSAEAEIAQLKLPDFEVKIEQAISLYDKESDSTQIALVVGIVNKGADSSVLSYQPHFKSATLDSEVRVVEFVNVFIADLPGGGKLYLYPKDFITSEKGKIIVRGGNISGRLGILVPGKHDVEISDGSAQLDVRVENYLHNFCTGSFRGSGPSKVPEAIPGELVVGPNGIEPK